MKNPLLSLLVFCLAVFAQHSTIAQCAPPAVVPVINGPSAVSTGQTFGYCLNNGNTNTTYEWSSPGGTFTSPPGAPVTSVSWSTAGTKTLTVTPRSSCGTTGTPTTLTITVVDGSVIAPPASISGPTTVCVGSTTQYSLPTLPGLSSAWNFCSVLTSAPAISVVNDNASITWTTEGSYILLGYYTNGTYSGQPRSIVISVISSGTATPVITGSATTCANTSTTFTASANAATSFSWSLDDGGTLTQNGAQATVAWNKTGGPYSLSVTASGCSATSITTTKTISVGTKPVAPALSVTNPKFCEGSTATFTATPGAASYTWRLKLGTQLQTVSTSPSNTFSAQQNAAGNYTVSVTVSNGFCDSDAAEFTWTAEPLPNASIIAPQPTGCLNTDYVFTTANVANATYVWSADGGTIVGDADKSSITIRWSTTGQKLITVKITNSCGLSVFSFPTPNFIVQDSSIPPFQLSAGGATTVCPTNYTYSAFAGLNANALTWQIIPSGGGTISLPSTQPPLGLPYNTGAIINWTTPGNYTLRVTASNNCGAAPAILDTPITVNAGTKPATVSISGSNTACVNVPATFTTPAQGGITYQWSTFRGVLTPSANTASVVWPTGVTGDNIFVTPSNSSCQGDATFLGVNVRGISVGGTTSTTTPETCTGPSGTPVTINLTGSNGSTTSWQFRTGTSPATMSGWQTIPTSSFLTSLNFTVTNNTAADLLYDFQVVLTNAPCVSAVSSITTVTVHPKPVISITDSAPVICSQQSTNIALSSNVTNTTINWTTTFVSAGVSGQSNGTGTAIQQALTYTGTAVGSVIYSATGTANGCTGNTVNETVSVRPLPSITNSPTQLQTSICNGGSINFTPTINPSSGAAITWTSAATGVTGATPSGTNQVTDVLTNTGTSNGTVTYTIVPIVNGCAGPSKDYVVTVKPQPPTIVAANKTICQGQNTNIQIQPATNTFSWTVLSTSGTITGASAGSGNVISNTLSNISNTPGTVVYRVSLTINGCSATPLDVTVTVNPMPRVDNANSLTICSGQIASFIPTSPVANTTFAYTATSTDPSITGYSAGTGSINQTLFNSGTSSNTVTYTITPSANGCTGNSSSEFITVHPARTAPAVVDKSICSGQNTNVSLPDVSTWTIKNVVNVSGGSAGSGSAINQVLTATTTTAGTITYTIVVNGTPCPSLPKDVTITVKPVPVLNAPGTQDICSGQAASFTPTANVSGTTFSYSASASGGTISGFASGTGSISQTLTNTGTAPGNVTYVITPTANSCNGSTGNYVVTVRPRITASINGSDIVCPTSATILRAEPTGATYAWSTGATTQQISITNGGTYSVTVSKSGFCSGTASKTETKISSFGSLEQTGDLCINGAVTFFVFSQEAVSYTWSTGSHAQMVTVFTPGTYSVDVTYIGGCTHSFSSTIVFTPPPPGQVCGEPGFTAGGNEARIASVKEEEANAVPTTAEEAIALFPNPAHDFLNIHLAEPVQKALAVTLTDTYGKAVLTIFFETGEQDKAVSTATLSPGVYVLQIPGPRAIHATRRISVLHP